MTIISLSPEENSSNQISMKKRLYWIMAKFAGIEPNGKKWILLFTFGMTIVFAPVNSIIGAVFYNECSAQPQLPHVLIATGIIETIWVFLIFYIFIYMPRKGIETNETILLLLWVLATLTVGVLVILTQVFVGALAKIELDADCDNCNTCSKVLYIGGWVWLGFKYLNLVKLVLCIYCSFRPKCYSP